MPEGSGPPIPWAAIPFFQGLKPAERDSLRPYVRLTTYEEGDTIFREREPALVFHFVLGGKVKPTHAASTGPRNTARLRLRAPGRRHSRYRT